jgi:predicted regulator of Ras-like GTPase activity (Roadblock/LC7/MglB family)
VPAAKVSGNWPAHILAEVSALGPDVAFLIPTSELGAALKRGKASFTWQQLCAWMATPPTTGTSYGEQNLDLPLPVIAPLFLASMKPARPQQRVTVDETIPDPFSAMAKGPKPGEAAAAPQPAAPEASGLPAEIVGRVASLSGVAGAVIALKEGLLVAHKVPNELNPETVAAFVPQVFSRVEQSTSVMEIGDLQNLSFTAGDRPWQIWKAGALFFAVMGRPNELLPSAQIKIYAAQLARQSKG